MNQLTQKTDRVKMFTKVCNFSRILPPNKQSKFKLFTLCLLVLTGLIHASCNGKKAPAPASPRAEPTVFNPPKPNEYGLDQLSWDLEYKGPREYPVSDRVSPCDDLYAYACEKIDKSFTLPTGQDNFNFAMGDAALRVRAARVEFLKRIIKSEGLPRKHQMMKDFFVACADKSAMSEEGHNRFLQLKDSIHKLSNKEQILDQSATNITTLDFSFIAFSSISNLQKPSLQDVYLDVDHLTPLKIHERYKDQALLKDYQALLEKFFSLLGLDAVAVRAEKIIKTEQRINEKYPKPDEVQGILVANSYVEKQAYISRYPLFRLERFFSQASAKVLVRDLVGASLTELHAILQESSAEELKDIMRRATLFELLTGENEEFAKMAKQFAEKHLGAMPPSKTASVTKICLGSTIDTFERNIDFEVIEEFSRGFDQKKFEDMIGRIKATLAKRIEANTWLGAESKKGALLKLEKMSFQTVKPKTLEDWGLLAEMDLSPLTPVANNLKIAQLKMQKKIKSLGTEENLNSWGMTPLEVNAYYSPPGNQFVMPMGILQPPLYDSSAGDEMNLGAIGMIIGHEIGHGIDNSGARYDEGGRVRQWMAEEDVKKFLENGSALKKYYEAEGHNGELTLGENIADLSGLNVAFDVAFPGGSGTIEAKKNFFLQSARVWCGVMLPQKRQELLQTDSHSLTPTRVNVPIKHVEGFYQAFQCKPGDKMFIPPEERVKIW